MKILLMWILTVFGSAFCTGYFDRQPELPKELPSNIEITYLSEGGFVHSHFSIGISNNVMRIIDQPAEKDATGWEVTISDYELKELYRIFVENEFDSIRPNKDAGVDDGYSRSIVLKVDGKQFMAFQGDGINSTKINAERFSNVEKALENLAKKYRK